MRNIRRIVAAALISIFAISTAGCSMVSKTESGLKKSPVAKFNKSGLFYKNTITRAQLDERLVGLKDQFKQQYGDNFMNNADAKQQYIDQEKRMIDNMITEKLLLNKAEELKLVPSDEAGKKELADKKLEELKKMYTEDIVKQSGFTGGYADQKFIDYARDLAIMDKAYEDMIKDVKVEDKEAQDYYNSNQMQFTEKPNQIHVAHILLNTEDEAKKVKERLDKGEDFAKVAKEVSIEPAAKESGGDLGTVPYVDSGFDQVFMTAAIALKEGTLSNPVNTQFGWHIIKAIKKEEYPVKKFDDVKEGIKKGLLQQDQQKKYTDTMTKWKEDAKIKYYEKNL